MKIQVRKCRFTGKIFEESDILEYKTHLLKLRKELAEKRYLKRVRSEFKDWLHAEREKIKYVYDISPWFLLNQRYIMDGCNSFGHIEKFYDNDEFIALDFRGYYSNTLSNTHSCPDNGVTNWSRISGLPNSYPGFYGTISGVLKRDNKYKGKYPSARLLNFIGLKTGSGGGGNENWSYGCSIFLDDWPGIKKEVEADEILKRLKGE